LPIGPVEDAVVLSAGAPLMTLEVSLLTKPVTA
jgi:hypothetical protein